MPRKQSGLLAAGERLSGPDADYVSTAFGPKD
jgi:hypothetical protein